MTNTKLGPIEVWLTQSNIEITCRVVNEDETTQPYGVESLSMRGAQREMTGYFIAVGYTPVGRWEAEAENGAETFRRFRPTQS